MLPFEVTRYLFKVSTCPVVVLVTMCVVRVYKQLLGAAGMKWLYTGRDICQGCVINDC